MTEERGLAPIGEIGKSLMEACESGSPIVEGRDTVLKFSKKGQYIIGKFLGYKRVDFVEDVEPFDAARFAVLEANIEGDNGPIVSGEVCSVAASGLLGWGLKKCANGSFLKIEYRGKAPGEGKDGKTYMMNAWDIRDITAFMKMRGIE